MTLPPHLLAELFAQHAPAVGLYARQFGTDGDELVQEAFVRLMSLDTPPPDVRPWLLLVIRRLAMDRRRSFTRRRAREAAGGMVHADRRQR